MIELTIESITKPLKQKGLSKISGKLKGVGITIDLNNLTVNYDSQEINLASIPGTYGGVRYFFLCPICGRRCRKLFKNSLIFACGTCQDRHRATLNRSKTDCQYYFELAFKEARKIDPSYYPEKGYVDYDNFPSRPKRMRAKTYRRHYRKFTSYLDKGVSYWLGGLK
ncbi:hypothetical protein I6J14_05790 [Streptococcus dysgalactiae]|uniref:hypothetical protein n=1 Tax=Streptococcus dysgalactiae TaxID=1334 RepID=UPI000E01F63C|nr:hypothetical protein [Streptococcus dysgalactiae]QQT02930.1 hypothetical protein I6J14_05790 [Streptococcus dysgalactiae]SUN44543.1 Uncharacterised protein [Streptococcus dysgalactiae subsp. dysgalactiae]SUN49000.1 Uncharacterised protein [Streptococcus dysgalactiae]SUN54770.1 Uncharacterised protein [Streptococcus dysgalactiae]